MSAKIVPFPGAKPDDAVSTRMSLLRSYIIAMSSSTDPEQIKRDILHRQRKLLEQWVNESVEHLGTAAVLEMVESMALHLRKDMR